VKNNTIHVNYKDLGMLADPQTATDYPE